MNIKILGYQILIFCIVGGIAFLIDYSVLILLTEICKFHYLISSMISFTLSLTFNYFASIKFIFKNNTNYKVNKKREFEIFVLLSLIGLGINQLLMWLFVAKANIYYMISKIFTTFVVMIWNFIN